MDFQKFVKREDNKIVLDLPAEGFDMDDIKGEGAAFAKRLARTEKKKIAVRYDGKTLFKFNAKGGLLPSAHSPY